MTAPEYQRLYDALEAKGCEMSVRPGHHGTRIACEAHGLIAYNAFDVATLLERHLRTGWTRRAGKRAAHERRVARNAREAAKARPVVPYVDPRGQAPPAPTPAQELTGTRFVRVVAVDGGGNTRAVLYQGAIDVRLQVVVGWV